jgi:uncharacterized membrane protein
MTNATESGCCGRQSRTGETSSVLDILAERFARGEIDKPELEERRQTIAGLTADTAQAGGRKGCC